MKVVITPKKLHGTVTIPSSKSMGHRHLICAALANGETVVENVSPSQDLAATCRVLRLLGAEIETAAAPRPAQRTLHIRGGLRRRNSALFADCGESGSTLRFLIPLALASGNTVTFSGSGRLAERPLQPYYDLFNACRICCQKNDAGLPLTVRGELTPGYYALPGNVSSQFFTGLLFALPLLPGDSVLHSTTALESASYVELTLACLRQYGVGVEKSGNDTFHITGNQVYQPGRYQVEGDFSQAAFWLAAAAIGEAILCSGLTEHSRQGDAVILDILSNMGGDVRRTAQGIQSLPTRTRGCIVDVADCPDLAPVLTALAACSTGTTQIVNAGRLRFKECDRLHAMATELNSLGADIEEEKNGLVIHGVPFLHGGTVSAWNDHRVAMALAVASQRAVNTVVIDGAESVAKSYPQFWRDFQRLGGTIRQEGSR